MELIMGSPDERGPTNEEIAVIHDKLDAGLRRAIARNGQIVRDKVIYIFWRCARFLKFNKSNWMSWIELPIFPKLMRKLIPTGDVN